MEYLTSFDVQLGWRKQEAQLFMLVHDQLRTILLLMTIILRGKGFTAITMMGNVLCSSVMLLWNH